MKLQPFAKFHPRQIWNHWYKIVPLALLRLTVIDFKFGGGVTTLGRSPTLTILVRVRWAVETPRGGNIFGYCDFFKALSGSHGRPFGIRHNNLPEAPPNGEIVMTSYPVTIKPRYLGNHATQIKSYYRTLSGSHGRSFRIRYKNSPEMPPSGEIMLTSYSVGNKNLLSRKLCIPDKKLIWNTISKSWLLFQNPSW